MEEIYLIKGDSSDIYEFLSKEIPLLDDTWEASWAITKVIGENPIMTGALTKNLDIFEANGTTIKTPANSFFIFQLTPSQTETLDIGKYFIGVEIRQMDLGTNTPIFRKEVLQQKLVIKEQIVL